MRFKTTICYFIAIIAGTTAFSQSADEVVSKYIQFTGGVKKCKRIKTITSTGTYNYGGVEFPFESWSKTPDLYKYTVTFNGKSFEQAYDGKEGWRIDGFKKETKKTILKDKAATAMANEADVELQSPFIDYKTKGHTISLEEKDSVNGKLCYKIKLVRKNGDEEDYYFSSENYELLKKHAIAKNTELNSSPLDIYYTDYKKADGLTVPFKITFKADGQTVLDITVKEVKLNVPVADAIFKP
jgi:hypothetical protein